MEIFKRSRCGVRGVLRVLGKRKRSNGGFEYSVIFFSKRAKDKGAQSLWEGGCLKKRDRTFFLGCWQWGGKPPRGGGKTGIRKRKIKDFHVERGGGVIGSRVF